MVNYSNGKVYKIESHLGDKIYIGSTTKEHLCQRMDTQRHNYDSWKRGTIGLTASYLIFDEYGVKNCQIVLLESYPCNSKDELESRKAFYIKSMECINKAIPNRTKEEIKEQVKNYDKKYRENNKEKIKQNRVRDKEKIKERDKLYQENNKEKISAQRKAKREQLKELNK
jgi:hypothetical protein